MKTSMWIVIVIVAFFVGFLAGYSLSSRDQAAPAGAPAVTDKVQ